MSKWRSFSAHQKLSVVVFAVIGSVTFVLGFLSITKAIVLPFQRTGGVQYQTADQIEQKHLDDLKRLDTDHDGLSDYDEIYVYHTSPFLADSDSDGIADGVEVTKGTDPNCPEGKTCQQLRIVKTENGVALSPTLPNDNANASAATNAPAATGGAAPLTDKQINAVIAETFGDPATLTPEKISDQLGKMSADDLRTFLAKLGIPQDALAKVDDATLRQSVIQTLNEIVAPTKQ